MISIRIIRIVDYVVIGISGSFFLLCLAGALYSIPWNRTRRKQEVTKDFHIFWKTRVVLQLASALWMISQWLRLDSFWQPGSPIFPQRVTDWTGNGVLCRVYLCVSLGLLEPFCLLTAVLLCRSSLSKWRAQEAGWANAWVLGMALLLTVPFAAAQTVAAWMSVILPGHTWETEKQVATYFLAPYVVGTPQQCDRSNGQQCLLCFFPAANSITGALSGALVAALLWHSTQRMIRKVINRRLKLRLRLFQLIFLAVIAASSAIRAAALVRGSPFSWAFQMMWLAHFVTLPLLVCIYTLFLVVLPTWETDRVAKRIQKAMAVPPMGQNGGERRWKDAEEASPLPPRQGAVGKGASEALLAADAAAGDLARSEASV